MAFPPENREAAITQAVHDMAGTESEATRAELTALLTEACAHHQDS
jgi:hypothetical protein